MQNISYFPILKWKKGEQCALKELVVGESVIFPVIELVDDVIPSSFFSTLKDCFTGSVYIDTIRCDENRNLLCSLIDYAKDNGIDARPVLYLDDVYEFYGDLTNKSQHIAIKIPVPEEFEGESFDDIIKYVNNPIFSSKVDIFLDAGEVINKKDASISFASYKAQLDKIDTELDVLDNIVICLTSFPENLEVEAGETVSFNRYDIKIFKRLNELYPNYRLGYSDYGVTKFTETELDFSKMKYGILPKIKYTIADQYIVLKGEKDRIRGVTVRSVLDMAKEIVSSDYYSGKDFSYGDAAIYEKATIKNSKPGGSTQWVTYTANHHLAFVMRQLSNLDDF